MIRKDTTPDLNACAMNFDWNLCKPCKFYRECIEIRKDKEYEPNEKNGASII